MQAVAACEGADAVRASPAGLKPRLAAVERKSKGLGP